MTTFIMKRSTCASGRRYVPSCSIGFCVASTMNSSPSGCVVPPDRKSTRLNSSHRTISYAVFCLKKKKKQKTIKTITYTIKIHQQYNPQLHKPLLLSSSTSLSFTSTIETNQVMSSQNHHIYTVH